MVAVVAGLAGWACASADAPGPGVARPDSLGVEVVESATPIWRDGAGWTVSAEPALTLGVAEGDPNQLFGRVVGALRLSDGRIVVATDNQLRYFDPAGGFLRSSGRTGGGPGEFTSLAWIGRLGGDSLLAWDRGNFRLTVIGPGGEYMRSARMDRPGFGFVNIVGLLPGRSLLARLESSEPVDGVRRDSLAYLRYSLDGGAPDTVARLPGPTFYTVVTRRPDGRLASARSNLIPFSPVSSAVTSRHGFFFGAGETYEIREYTGGGDLRRLIRGPVSPVALTDDHRAAYRVWILAALPNDEARRALEHVWGEMPVAKTAPAYGGLGADDDGNLWVFNYPLPGETVSTAMVFDSTGVLLGGVVPPRGLALTHIGADFVLGIWRDESDVEYVRLYRLTKAGA
jgi:hypothetical protein